MLAEMSFHDHDMDMFPLHKTIFPGMRVEVPDGNEAETNSRSVW